MARTGAACIYNASERTRRQGGLREIGKVTLQTRQIRQERNGVSLRVNVSMKGSVMTMLVSQMVFRPTMDECQGMEMTQGIQQDKSFQLGRLLVLGTFGCIHRSSVWDCLKIM